MTEKQITSYQIKEIMDIHKIFQIFRAHPPAGWWFRGQSDILWDLLPKAGRKKFYLENDRDLGRFNEWKTHAIAYLKQLPENDWECLALAQHHGFASRLLDWTYNPLVALYFAANENLDTDGVVFCYEPETFIKVRKNDLNTPQGVNGLITRNITPRMLNQKAVFSVHSPSNQLIKITDHHLLKELSNLVQIIIPKEIKKEIIEHLADYGVNNVTLFPDLDGLSKHVNWYTTTIVEIKNRKTSQDVED